jgi:uncharacterized RDD family membrane protein YckC
MTDDDGRTRGLAVTPTGTTSGRTKARLARPLATRSALPLFPLTSNERSQDQLRPRAPLAVRRQTPAVPRVRPPADGPPSDTRLLFEDPRPAAPHASPRAAAPWVRLVAGLIDTVLLASLDAVVIVLTLRLAELDLQSIDTLPAAPLTGFLVLLNGGYVVVLTLVGGQTFGKMVCGIRVVNRAGRSVTTRVALVRALGCVMSVLPLGLGGVWMFFDTDHRALHDRLAGTCVLMVPGTSRKDFR